MTTEAPPPQSQSPLSTAELAELEATLLPALERHHLRLLAHSLRSLQAIAAHQPAGALPGHDAICTWASQQPALADAPCFQAVLVEQLEAAGRQLQQRQWVAHDGVLVGSMQCFDAGAVAGSQGQEAGGCVQVAVQLSRLAEPGGAAAALRGADHRPAQALEAVADRQSVTRQVG